MSNLWAAIVGHEGLLPFELNERTHWVDALDEKRVDKVLSKHPLGLCPRHEDRWHPGGVAWANLTSGKALTLARQFYHPPTVLFSKGAKGVALWAIREGSTLTDLWEGNEKLARLFKGRLKDGDPTEFRLDIRNKGAEWRFDCFYDLHELVGRL